MLESPGKEKEKSTFLDNFNEINEQFGKRLNEYKIIQSFFPFVLYFLFFLVYSCLFKVLILSVVGHADSLLIVFLEAFFLHSFSSLILSSFIFILPKKAQLVVFPLTSVLLVIYTAAQYTMMLQTGKMFRLATIATATNALGFAGTALKNVPIYIWVILGVILAVIVLIDLLIAKKACGRAKRDEKNRRLFSIIYSLVFALVFIASLIVTISFVPQNYSEMAKISYEFVTEPKKAYYDTDLFTFLVHDAETQISSFFVKSTVTQEIDEYFENKESLSENDMTGIFKDKNLLIIQLESFDKRLLDEDICPNICSLLDDSIYFENYYGILAGDEPTFDNEFAVNTGYYAFSGFNASTEIVDDTFSYSLANAFSRGGVSN
ncbi:MAG: hypothetical protein LUI06_02580 [Ruminococcus sp.]|nr:hypothetical protein [Ruminococcus sp.]